MFGVVKWLIRSSPGVRRRVTQLGYELLSRHVDDPRLVLMNYGYAALEGDGSTIELAPADEFNRYGLQLYHRVAAPCDLGGKDVLEVGSGRGGGARFLLERFGPASVVGVDAAASAVEFCRRAHRAPGLSFRRADAEALPFAAETFDAVLNVESSHCYGSVAGFLSEVQRVLRPGGWLLFADLRDRDQAADLRAALEGCGLEVVEREDVTAHVIAALDRTAAHKETLLRDMPRAVRGLFRDQSGAPGGAMDRAFRSGERIYLRYAARKPPGG